VRDPVPANIWDEEITPTERDPVPSDMFPSQEKKSAPAPDMTSSMDDLTWRQAIISAFKNIPSSGYQMGKDIVGAVSHPIQTGKAIGKTAIGAAEKLIPGEQEYEQYADLFVDMMKNRYGSVENFKQTVAQDPVGVFADAASVFLSAGAAIRAVGAGSKVGAISRAGAVVTRVGAAMEPMNIAARGLAFPLRIGMRNLPSKLYRSAVKFTTKLSEKERVALAQTALDEKIMPTLRGLENLTDKINVINKDIAMLIDKAQTTGAAMPVEELFKSFDDLKKTYLKESGKPMKNVRAIESVKREITQANDILKRRVLTPKEAQALKVKIYKELEGYYSKVNNLPASVDAQMAVARSAKEFLEEVIVDENFNSIIKRLNERDGALIELRNALEGPASRISNRDIIGIGVPIKTGAGGTIGGLAGGKVGTGIGAGAGLVLGILDTPQAKAGLAIFLNRLKKRGIKVRMTPTLARLLAVEGERARKATEEVIP